MAKKEQIQKIVNSLIEGTKDGSVIWKKTNSIFNSETRHEYSTTTDDEKTKFNFEVHLDNNFQPKTGWSYIYMYNDDLIDGKIQIPYNKYEGLDTLQVLIYNKWIKSTLPTKNESSVLDDILNKIGDKQSRRDRVLDDILLDIPKEEPKEELKKKSLWQRLGL